MIAKLVASVRYGLCLGAAVATFGGTAEVRAETAPVVSNEPERQSFAVVIGNNRSLGRRRPDLHYADDDAARYFEILQTLAPQRVALLTEFDRDTERLFPGAHAHAVRATRRNLEAEQRRLAGEIRAANARGQETELYFIFAGHGDVDRGEGFIELEDARFSATELKNWLKGIPFTRAHVVLDSCNSFFMLGSRKPGGRHFATSEDAARSLGVELPNVGVFLSTSAEGDAFEWSEIQSGIFSHVVRSGLMGAADADLDGSVSYGELAGFVATATADVKNPNMRPHVYSRGPGARDDEPIAELQTLRGVRHFQLGDEHALRVRLRNKDGLPLLDAHTEAGRSLQLALPEAWAAGAVIERTWGAGANTERTFHAVPVSDDTVTLASLTITEPASGARGPDETFQALFAQPFGPVALARYLETKRNSPPPVFGVSKEDVERMQLVLGQIEQSERNRRLTESFGSIGFGGLMAGGGTGVLQVEDGATRDDKRTAHITGGILLGLGGLMVLGGAGSLFATTDGEEAAAEFRRLIDKGADPTQAFAAADKRLREMSKNRLEERYAAGFVGTLGVLACSTGLIWSEIAADGDQSRFAARMGWSSGIVAGGLLLAEGIFATTPVDSLTRIWREDPSLHQYQTSVLFTGDGALLQISGQL